MELLDGFVFNVLKVALGLGFVIFIHELGHFLLAKWNGVKVEKFSIGFGPALVKFVHGETEYALSVIPLGGFVKMLGETAEENAATSNDPRSYNNKSVGARMAIISAGVIMNILLGLICFIIVYSQGVPEIPAVVGSVLPGTPAYEKGLRPGDEVVAINGQRGVDYQDLRRIVSLSAEGESVDFEVRRPGQSDPIRMSILPRRDGDAMNPSIGVRAASDVILWPGTPFLPPAGLEGWPRGPHGGFRGRDQVVSIGPPNDHVPTLAEIDVNAALLRFRDQPLEFEVERNAKIPGAPEPKLEADPSEVGPEVSPTVITVPPVNYVDFGFRMGIEEITSLRENGPAAQAGIKVGDVILKVNGKDDVDPLRLADLCAEFVGKTISLVVRRGAEEVTVNVTPTDSPPDIEGTLGAISAEPVDIPSLGLAFHVGNAIKAVRPGSVADKAGIQPGRLLHSTRLTLSNLSGDENKVVPVALGETRKAWPAVFRAIQGQPRRAVPFVLVSPDGKTKTTVWLLPEPVAGWFNPSRGLQFVPLSRQLPPQGVVESIKLGYNDTVQGIVNIYQTLRGLVQSRLSHKLIGGPIRIADVAYEHADAGWVPLIHFLGMLSINLAVLNFLPIPPLDGGQMVFLIAEKVRGRPLPDSALIAGTYLGLFLVLSLMAFVILQDVLSFF